MRWQSDGWRSLHAAGSSKSLSQSPLWATRKNTLVQSERLSKRISAACGTFSSFSTVKPVSCGASHRISPPGAVRRTSRPHREDEAGLQAPAQHQMAPGPEQGPEVAQGGPLGAQGGNDTVTRGRISCCGDCSFRTWPSSTWRTALLKRSSLRAHLSLEWREEQSGAAGSCSSRGPHTCLLSILCLALGLPREQVIGFPGEETESEGDVVLKPAVHSQGQDLPTQGPLSRPCSPGH